MSSSEARSWVFARGQLPASTGRVVFTVPAGEVLLMKSGYFGMSLGLATDISVFALADDNETYVAAIQEVGNETGQFEWSGWIVLNPGYRVQVVAAANPFYYWLSGALLRTSLPPPIQPFVDVPAAGALPFVFPA